MVDGSGEGGGICLQQSLLSHPPQTDSPLKVFLINNPRHLALFYARGVFHPSPNEPPASVSKTDQICFDWGNFPTLFKAVSHFNDVIKGPRQKDE